MSERKEHILVVDDDALTLKVAEDLLGGQYRVSCVKSGEQALDFLEKEMPDLLLLDLHMKGMDGFAPFSEQEQDHGQFTSCVFDGGGRPEGGDQGI